LLITFSSIDHRTAQRSAWIAVVIASAFQEEKVDCFFF